MRLGVKQVMLVALLGLAGCGGAEMIYAPDELVARQTYRHDGPASLTLFTVINNGSNAGGHSALLVNAPSQRVLFDPAGTMKHPHIPERGDVLYGMSDPAVEFYKDYHARVSWRVVEHRVNVSPEVAELVLAKVQANGPVPKANCANSISGILSEVPGFEDGPRTFFPKQLMAWFSEKDVVFEDTFYDDSPDNNKELVLAPNLLLPN